MNTLLDIDSLDCAVRRPDRHVAPRNTDPLRIEDPERDAISRIGAEIGRNLNNRSLSTFDQLNAFHHSVQAIQHALDGDWNSLASSVSHALESTLRIDNVACYLICRQDEAKRNLASDERAALVNYSTRLGLASVPRDPLDRDRARCLRAAVYAAIAADRGLVHILKDNLGSILATASREDFPARRSITWTDQMRTYARRFRNSTVRIP